MDKVTFIDIESLEGIKTHAIIDRGDGSFLSMSKAEYEKRQAEAEHFTPIVTDEAEAK